MASKQEIRQEVRLKRRALAPSDIEIRSERVLAHLCRSTYWKEAKTVLLYHALPGEVSTLPLLDILSIGKKTLLPVVVGNELELRLYENKESLQIGTFGVWEPQGAAFTDFGTIDLVIVPGVAFDRAGSRLGYGKGYYDRLLPQLTAYRIGIGFDFQFYTRIPHDSYDAKMDFIVSEQEMIDTHKVTADQPIENNSKT